MDEEKLVKTIEILKNEKPSCGEKIIYPEGERCEAYNNAISATEMQIAKEPIQKQDQYTEFIHHYYCPNCARYFGQAGIHNCILFQKEKWCQGCGQKINWSKTK